MLIYVYCIGNVGITGQCKHVCHDMQHCVEGE